MSRFTKIRTLTELENIRQSFPNYDDTPLKAVYSTDGKILSLETTDNALKAILRAKEFTEI